MKFFQKFFRIAEREKIFSRVSKRKSKDKTIVYIPQWNLVKEKEEECRKLLSEMPNRDFFKYFTMFSFIFPEEWDRCYLAQLVKKSLFLLSVKDREEKWMLISTKENEVNYLFERSFSVLEEKGIKIRLRDGRLILYLDDFPVDENVCQKLSALHSVVYSYGFLRKVKLSILSSFNTFFSNTESFAFSPEKTIDVLRIQHKASSPVKESFTIELLKRLLRKEKAFNLLFFVRNCYEDTDYLGTLAGEISERPEKYYDHVFSLMKEWKNEKDLKKRFLVSVLFLNAYTSHKKKCYSTKLEGILLTKALYNVSLEFQRRKIRQKLSKKTLKKEIESLFNPFAEELVKQVILGIPGKRIITPYFREPPVRNRKSIF